MEFDRKTLVVLVDDSPVILKAVSSVLCSEYNIFTLAKPEALEKFLRQMTPELFLLDYQMPGINGLELIEIIRRFPEHKSTPIIFLTSEGTIDLVTAAMAMGACDFIVKPFNPDALRSKIAKWITYKKAERYDL
jgi:CheY-like chemotaxis protein